jgi:polyhydroxyalkanoate synthesis regulator phasin
VDEIMPDTGKNLMEEAVDDRNARNKKTNEIDSLSSRVSALEKRMTAIQDRKKAPTNPPKQSKIVKKRY